MDEEQSFRFVVPGAAAGEPFSEWITVLGGRGHRLPFSIQITVGVAEDGRLVCTGLRTLPGVTQEVTARSLRQIPLSQILAALGERYGAGSGLAEALQIVAERHGLVVRTAMDDPPRYERPPQPRGYRIPREHFEHVAEVYREALRVNPRQPYSYITKTLQTTTPTARRWVQRAREMGLLGEGRRGRPGEHSPEEPDTAPALHPSEDPPAE